MHWNTWKTPKIVKRKKLWKKWSQRRSNYTVVGSTTRHRPVARKRLTLRDNKTGIWKVLWELLAGSKFRIPDPSCKLLLKYWVICRIWGENTWTCTDASQVLHNDHITRCVYGNHGISHLEFHWSWPASKVRLQPFSFRLHLVSGLNGYGF